MSCSRRVSPPSASSRWFSTICCAPPSCIERRTRQLVRPGCDGGTPQALHDELEEGGLDVLGPCRLGLGERVRRVRDQPAGRCSVDHRLDQIGLEPVRRLARRQATVPFGDRVLDRLARGRAVQVLDTDVVREEAGDPPLEAIELRPGVVADREQDVDAEVRRVDDRSQAPSRSRQPPSLVAVVEEEVLELVEDDEQRAHAAPSRSAASARQGRPAASAGAPGRRAPRQPQSCIASIKRRQRVVAPGAERRRR